MNFFATGNGRVETGLDFNYILPVGSHGSNFAESGQTIRQSFSIVKKVFKLFDNGAVNFVLIDLAPDTLLLGEDGTLTPSDLNKNLQTLNDIIKLCRDKEAVPVGLTLPVAPATRQYWQRSFLNLLAAPLNELEKTHGLKIVNLLNLNLGENYFTADTDLTREGAIITSTLLTAELYRAGIFPKADFGRLNYAYFYTLSHLTDKNSFHAVMDKVFADTLAKLRRKEKIRVAFVTDHAATWCGDALYNLFATNPRFDTTVFLCLSVWDSTLQDFQHDLEQFKSAGINVVGVPNRNQETPPQDILIFLRPYVAEILSKSFQINVLTPQTLMAYIPYGIETTAVSSVYESPLFRLSWKHFFETEISREFVDSKCKIGIPRGVVSGAPKLDLFFEDADKITFPWKMTRPDAKKIIWAPHHSINGYSTFNHNYRFMYEFAKAHPETSWIVKPHPRLLVAAVEAKIFPSIEAYENYLREWDALPNAQVYTGGYYQDVFATSDGMIHDSLSFIAEYQYTHKPMIFLLNKEEEKFTDLGRKILDASYLIDGKNHAQIAEALQKIFIEGNDTLKDKRRKVFDELLDYRRLNGVSASEFIFKTISKELELS